MSTGIFYSKSKRWNISMNCVQHRHTVVCLFDIGWRFWRLMHYTAGNPPKAIVQAVVRTPRASRISRYVWDKYHTPLVRVCTGVYLPSTITLQLLVYQVYIPYLSDSPLDIYCTPNYFMYNYFKNPFSSKTLSQRAPRSVLVKVARLFPINKFPKKIF